MIVDSDEEAGAAALAFPSQRSRQMTLESSAERSAPDELKYPPLMDPMTEALQARCAKLSVLHRNVPEIVPFIVGGVFFAVGRAILEKDPGSVLFLMAYDHYRPRKSQRFPHGAGKGGRKRSRAEAAAEDAELTQLEEISIPDKNPLIFGMLLNMLRGYKMAVPEEWIEHCREEAMYYGLRRSWNTCFRITPEEYFFRNIGKSTRLQCDTTVALASSFFSSGEHHIDFSVVKCDRVGVGLMSVPCGSAIDVTEKTSEGHGGTFYWNDGRITIDITRTRTHEAGFLYPSDAIIRVYFDADDRIVRWTVNEEYCVAMERVPEGRLYAFCVIASQHSQVNILPT